MPRAEEHLLKKQVLKLLQCVSLKDVNQITKLINFGIPGLVNYSEPEEGLTALHIAAASNDESLIELLLDFGADCNVADNIGVTPFMRAAELGHVEALTLQFNLFEGLDISAIDVDGKNILFYCLHGTKRHETCLELALKRGADIRVMDKSGSLLLHEACRAGLDVMTELLLEAGVDPDKMDTPTKTKPGVCALHICSELGKKECARLLLKHNADPDTLDTNTQHSSHKAALSNNYDILKLLSAYGGNLGTLTKSGDTAMHFAAQNGYAPLCKFLGQRGCPATAKNDVGHIPRILAKKNGFKLAIKMCRKAEKSKSGTKSGTQLHIVKFYDWMMENKDNMRPEILQLENATKGKVRNRDLIPILLRHRSPLDDDQLLEVLKMSEPQKDGNVDFELFFTGKKFINKLYLTAPVPKKGKGKGKGKKGGKLKIGVPICTKPESVRRESGGPLMNYIEKQVAITDRTRFGPDSQPENVIQNDSYWYCHSPDPTFMHINEAVKYNDIESIKLALKEGLDVNEKDRFYKTPLMLACLEGNYELTKFLIENGAEVNCTDNFKWTPLHFACHSGQLDVVQLLIENGALIDAQSFNGGTPLMRAIESTSFEVVELLINLGSKVLLETKKGLTALDIAESYADRRIVDMVEKKTKESAPKDNKKKGKRKGSPSKKVSNKVGAGSRALASATRPASVPSLQKPISKSVSPAPSSAREREKRKSIFRATTAISSGDPRATSIRYYVPKKAWAPVPSTDARIADKFARRERFGFQIDFEDYKPPYQCHVDELAKKLSDVT